MNEWMNELEEMNTDVELRVNFSLLSTSDQNCNTSSDIPEPLQYQISKHQHFSSYLRTEQQRNGVSSGRITATCFACATKAIYRALWCKCPRADSAMHKWKHRGRWIHFETSELRHTRKNPLVQQRPWHIRDVTSLDDVAYGLEACLQAVSHRCHRICTTAIRRQTNFSVSNSFNHTP